MQNGRARMTGRKSFYIVAPMILFIIIFSLLIIWLFVLNRKKGASDETTLQSINLKTMDTPELKPFVWKKYINTTAARERNGVFEQVLDNGTIIRYSIDPWLQQKADSILSHFKIPWAAVFMYSIKDGRILVFKGRSEKDKRLTDLELITKAWAPGASVFKVVSASALLSTGAVNVTDTWCYHGGSHRLTSKLLVENPAKDNKCVNLPMALAQSANVVFARLGKRYLTRKSLLYHASSWGFHMDFNFILPVEKSRIKILARDENAVAFTAAGFGEVTLSPFHGAWMMSIAGNDGIPVSPWLVESVKSSENKILFSHKPEGTPQGRVISSTQAASLRKMLELTVTSGTARDAFYKVDEARYNFTCAGKTGTLARTEPEYLEYSWFTGYAPADKPEVVFAVALINPAKWRTKSIFVAATMLKLYFEKYHKEKSG